MITHHPKVDLESVRNAEKTLAQLDRLPAEVISAAKNRGQELVLAEGVTSQFWEV